MTQTPKQLPDAALQFVGQRAVWREDRPTVIEGEASLLPTEDTGLVLGVRWARTPDGKTVGEAYGLAQFLMERPDGTSRWSTPVLVADETTAMPEPLYDIRQMAQALVMELAERSKTETIAALATEAGLPAALTAGLAARGEDLL